MQPPMHMMQPHPMHLHGMGLAMGHPSRMAPPVLPDGMAGMGSLQAFYPLESGSFDPADRKKSKKIKVYTCKICRREFRWASNLRRHAGIHTGLKPYKCAHCGVGFNNSSNRRKHEKSHARGDVKAADGQCSSADDKTMGAATSSSSSNATKEAQRGRTGSTGEDDVGLRRSARSDAPDEGASASDSQEEEGDEEEPGTEEEDEDSEEPDSDEGTGTGSGMSPVRRLSKSKDH